MAKKTKYAGKFVIGFDTLCDGIQCTTTTNEKGKSVPALFDNYDEAFKELFDSAFSSLKNHSAKDLKSEFGITKTVLKKMDSVNKAGVVKDMEKFLDKYPNLNTNNEFVEKADEFILGRKAIFTGKGVVITGEKLK